MLYKTKIYFTINIMTKFGETHNFSGKDFINKIEGCLGRQFDGVIGNSTKPAQHVLDKYSEQKSDFVHIDPTDSFWEKCEFHFSDVLDSNTMIARHDPKKLAHIIQRIIGQD